MGIRQKMWLDVLGVSWLMKVYVRLLMKLCLRYMAEGIAETLWRFKAHSPVCRKHRKLLVRARDFPVQHLEV